MLKLIITFALKV